MKKITYTTADVGKTYVYTVREKDGQVAGYTYDNEVYTVTVDVTSNAGKITATPTIKNKAGATVTAMTFANTYTVPTGSIKLTKTIQGPVTANDLQNLKFTVTDSEGNKKFEELLGSNAFSDDGNGNLVATIDGLDVSKTYTVTETLTDLDGTKVTVTYKIGTGSDVETRDATGSVTTEEFSITAGEEKNVKFTNAYTSNPVDLNLEATKTLTGATLTAGQFSFN